MTRNSTRCFAGFARFVGFAQFVGFAHFVVLLLLVCAPAGFAQKNSTTRSVQGSVSNPDDSAVPGAVVQIKNLKTLQVRSFITLEDGTYRFFDLSPDVDYELKADFQGASSGPKTLSSFDSRKKAIINLKLNKK